MLLGRKPPPAIKLPDYAPHREQLLVPGYIFGPMSRPGDDPRIRLPTPDYRIMTNGFGFGVPVIVPAVPLPVDANVDGMVLARASPLPP